MPPRRPPNSVETTPSGIEIAFWDQVGLDGLPQQRRYAIDGERLVNVTTVLGVLDKPALLDWAANLAREGKSWRDVRDEAGERGKDTHSLLLAALLRERFSIADLPEETQAHAQAGVRWKRARRPKVVEAERMVAAPSHGYAGRIDLLAELDGLPGLTLVDFKTVTKWSRKKVKHKDCGGEGCSNCDGGKVEGELYPPYDENLLQLDLYTPAIEESGYPVPDQGMVVRLGPDGEYDETIVDLVPERGLGILRAYRCKAAATTALRDARKREAVAA